MQSITKSLERKFTKMQNNEHSFFFAKSINELSYQLKSIKELRVVGGCTALKEDDTKIISLRGIAELSSIGKHERYIDFGAGVTLSEIINLERSKTPAILTEATESIANPSIRNLATIGGNICQGNKTQTLFAPLLALDARLEFRNQAETFPILIRNFQKVPEGFFLASIRVPLSDWDISLFFRLGGKNTIKDSSASFAFLVDTEKNSINNIRIAFSSHIAFRLLDLETKLIGTKLPLSEKDFPTYLKIADEFFSIQSEGIIYNPVLKTQFLNVLRYSLEQLT